MSHCYPEGGEELYYVEFDRGDKKGEFTLFKRQWMYTEEELAVWEKKDPKHIFELRMCNEVHPWNIFTATYGAPGCMPDESWVKWMVDALNEKYLRDTDPKAWGKLLQDLKAFGDQLKKG